MSLHKIIPQPNVNSVKIPLNSDILPETSGIKDLGASAEEIQEPSSRVSLSASSASCVPEGVNRRAFNPLRKRSKSDPVLQNCQLPQGDSFFSVSDCGKCSTVKLQHSMIEIH
ncbi:hypothetical protein DV515_00010279 [Chloebia gouldiae]|uniref:Uncharacterized protein n=1 Tax=Chloebia gouldiae TaxID=44316 RepID=A0A3L8SAI1_CHLGU|nr:hypothetical protein DV515_00010279 [Chloebia gouldiae]